MRVCHHLSSAEVPDNINVSINLSPVQIRELKLPQNMVDILDRYNISSNRITFEITETAAMLDPTLTRQRFEELRMSGFKLSVDDFGTGYSSLSYLRKYPIDVLKIDRSFILDMAKEKGDKVLVSAIISMAKAMNMQVVAEGVETKQEVDILLELGCDYIQGFYYSKPMPAQSMLQYILNLKIP